MSSRQMVSLRDRHVGAPLNIAIVGSGISGMAAAWLLSRRHRVTVFEKDGRLGGHSNTTLVQLGDRTVPVDTGFIVYNDVNYPNLVALFDHLQVPTKPSRMSFCGLRGWRRAGIFRRQRQAQRPVRAAAQSGAAALLVHGPGYRAVLSRGAARPVARPARGHHARRLCDGRRLLRGLCRRSSAADGGGDLVLAAGCDARSFGGVDRALLRESWPAAAERPPAMAHRRWRLARICAAPDRQLCRPGAPQLRRAVDPAARPWRVDRGRDRRRCRTSTMS